MSTFRVVVKESYEIRYDVEASSGVEARNMLRADSPTFDGAVTGDPEGRPMDYQCVRRTVSSPKYGTPQRDEPIQADYPMPVHGEF